MWEVEVTDEFIGWWSTLSDVLHGPRATTLAVTSVVGLMPMLMESTSRMERCAGSWSGAVQSQPVDPDSPRAGE